MHCPRFKWMHILLILLLAPILGGAQSSCDDQKPTSDQIQREQQERILQQGTSAVGMVNIINFREKRTAKEILELRDQEGLVTYTYLFSDTLACVRPMGDTIGFPIPYATQYTNPQKIEASAHQYGYAVLPQADPNGLFSPSSAEGTWSLMKDPKSPKVGPSYTEPRIIVTIFKLPVELECDSVMVKFVDLIAARLAGGNNTRPTQ